METTSNTVSYVQNKENQIQGKTKRVWLKRDEYDLMNFIYEIITISSVFHLVGRFIQDGFSDYVMRSLLCSPIVFYAYWRIMTKETNV